MKYLVNSEDAIKDIADAVREVTGSTDRLTVNTIPSVLLAGGGGGGGDREVYNVTVPIEDWTPDTHYYYNLKLPHNSFGDVMSHYEAGNTVVIMFEEYTGTSYTPDNDKYAWIVVQVLPHSRYQYSSGSTLWDKIGILTVGINKNEYNNYIANPTNYDLSHFKQDYNLVIFYDSSDF